MNQRFINIITSKYFIALVLFVVIFVFVSKDIFVKYKLILFSSSIIDGSKNDYVFYEDLNNDGKSEKVRRYIDEVGVNAMNVYTHDGIIINQFNIGREAELNDELFAFDRNKNGLKEVYSLSHNNDSIFLNWVEPMNKNDNMPQSRFITVMRKNKYGTIDYKLKKSFVCADLDNDLNNEIIFTINGGYSKFPRKVFAYDFVKDSVHSSPFTGAKIGISDVMDINNDGYVEIIVTSNAPANIQPNDSILDDEHSYLMVLDHNLNFLFKPIPFFGYPSSINVLPVQHSGDWNLIARFLTTGTNGDKQRLMLFNSNGRLLKEKRIEDKIANIYKISTDKYETFGQYSYNTGEFEIFDNELNTISKTIIEKKLTLLQYDIDGNGIEEWIAKDNTNYQTLWVYRNSFVHPIKIQIPVSGIYNIFKIDFVQNGTKSKIHIQKDDYDFVYDYIKNPFYFFKFPFYFGIYLLLLLITFFIQKVQRVQIEQKLAIKKQISQLQLKTIKSQMDPHFTFNALNTISSFIYKEDKEKAHRYFTKFSKLVRATLDASDKIVRSVGEELDFVENYLTMEKFRFRDKFEYKIVVSEEVDWNTLIPKMIIQIYVENAIKHGLKHKEEDGLLSINISQNKNLLSILIEDNGIGRKKAAEIQSFGTGHGLKIMENIFDLYYKLYKKEIHQTVEDLIDGKGEVLGTKVKIEIPVKEK